MLVCMAQPPGGSVTGDDTPRFTEGTAHNGAEPEATRTTARGHSDSPRRN